MTPEISSLLRALGERAGRDAAARALAAKLSCDYLLIFLRDAEINILLPAPGFPKTLPAGKQWREFLGRCEERGKHLDVLPYPSVQHLIPARGIRGDDGSVFVFLGGRPEEKEIEEICEFLTLLNVVFVSEQQSDRAMALIARSSQTAEEARELAGKLHESRRELRESFWKLRESEARKEAILNSALDAILTIDHEGRLVDFNAAAESIFGYSRQVVIGKPMTELISLPRVREQRDGGWAEYLGTGDGAILHQQIELSALRSDGREFSSEMAIIPIPGSQPPQFTVFIRDISERRKAEEALVVAQKKLHDHALELEERVSERTAQLEESLKTMESYNYSIAHDLRSPLRGMIGFADLLLEEYAPLLDELGKDYLRRIKTGARRMDELVRDLLEYGRLAHVELPLETLDLGAAVAGAIDHLSVETQTRQAVMDLRPPWPPVLANPWVLNQIFVNLIGNAIKFVGKETTPRVTVRAERKPKGVRVWVEDNGLGIGLTYQKRIFNMFERLHTQHSHPGTGIGLAIVKKGVERMGGTCGVESEPGKGSRFWIELPKGR